MLRPPNSPAPWPGAPSHPCARCGEPTAGILPGDLCAACTGLLERRAPRLGRCTARGTSLAPAGYISLALRAGAPAWAGTGRAPALAAGGAWGGGGRPERGAGGGARGRGWACAGERDTSRPPGVRAGPPQSRLGDGRFRLAPPGTPLFPAELVRSEPQVTLALEASRSRPRTEIAYSAAGASWEAVYQIVLADGKASVSGAATVRSQAVRADSAEVQLVAGSIARARSPQPLRGMITAQAVLAEDAVSASEQAVGETHVYQIPGRVTLEPGVPVTTALFPRAATPYVQELIVPGALPWRGVFGAAPAPPGPVPVQGV